MYVCMYAYIINVSVCSSRVLLLTILFVDMSKDRYR